MAAPLLALAVLFLAAAVLSDPLPGRIPRVYNALITSNQNLQPSKAVPVYQPVLHDPFGYPYQPVFYPGGLYANELLPAQVPNNNAAAAPAPPPEPPKGDQPSPPPEPPKEDPATSSSDSSSDESTETSAPQEVANATPAPPPLPPSEPRTEPPIPLNQFGLPPQVLPLGSGYNGLSQFGPLHYPYPSYRFYDPYDFYNYNPYLGISPVYRPLPNVLSPALLSGARFSPEPVRPPATVPEKSPKDQNPPSEPNDLSLLNYSPKDPSIPDVPPPPLPEGGLKDDKAE